MSVFWILLQFCCNGFETLPVPGGQRQLSPFCCFAWAGEILCTGFDTRGQSFQGCPGLMLVKTPEAHAGEGAGVPRCKGLFQTLPPGVRRGVANLGRGFPRGYLVGIA